MEFPTEWKIKVNNMPPWVREDALVVIRMVDGSAWFYDSWDNPRKAIQQAEEVGGHVIPIDAIL